MSEWPNGYCDWCRYLEPTEADQTDEKEPHRCTFLNQRIEHGAFHPRLPTPDNCPILLVEEYQSGRATGKSEMTMDELAKEINDNVRNKSGIPREFFDGPPKGHGPDEPADRIAQAACLWKEDEDGHWFTACDNGFTFNEGGPKDNRFGYCPYCGRRVVFMRHTPEGPGYSWRILEDGEDNHTP